MNSKLPKKIILIIIFLLLTLISVTVAYLEVDDVEIRDIGNSGLTAEREDGSFVIKVPDQEDSDQKDRKDIHKDKSEIKTGNVNDDKKKEPASGEYADIDLLILVNKNYHIGADFIPVDLVRPMHCAKDRNADSQYLTRESFDAFNRLSDDAMKLGYEIVVTTAYRSYNLQSYLYNNYVARDGQAAADRYSARPGTSEHQTGLAADVSSPSVGYQLVQAYGDTAEGKWLAENCHRYGFIIRFPLGKENITGYMYEPWHIRYVGTKAAKEIYERDITFEEYLNKI